MEVFIIFQQLDEGADAVYCLKSKEEDAEEEIKKLLKTDPDSKYYYEAHDVD